MRLTSRLFILSICTLSLVGCSQKYYAGRELPKVYLAELNWNIQQTKNGVFLSVSKINGDDVYFNSRAYLKPGKHLIEYSCQNVVWTDPYPDSTIITVEANTRYGMVFSGFSGSSYHHPHPECDVDPPNNACFHQETIFIKFPMPCTYNLVAKPNERPEFSKPLKTNPYITNERHRSPLDFPKYCNSKDSRECHFYGLPAE